MVIADHLKPFLTNWDDNKHKLALLANFLFYVDISPWGINLSQ